MNVSDDKLNEIVSKIDSKIEEVTNSTTISETSKETMLAQLEALKSIVNDKIASN